MLKYGLLGRYSAVEAELTLQCLWFTPLCKQALLFASPELVPGMDLRDTDKL